MIDDSIAYSSSLFFSCWLDSKPSAGKVRQPRLLSFIEWGQRVPRRIERISLRDWGNLTVAFSETSLHFSGRELNDIIQELKRKPSMAVEVLAPIMSQRAAMKRKSYCLVHQRQCFLRTARQQTAGSSCTAHSRQGKQLGLADANVLSLLAWVGLRLEVGESEATLENVDQFPTETLQRLLGSQYFIEPCRMDPRMFGLLVFAFAMIVCRLHLFFFEWLLVSLRGS